MPKIGLTPWILWRSLCTLCVFRKGYMVLVKCILLILLWSTCIARCGKCVRRLWLSSSGTGGIRQSIRIRLIYQKQRPLLKWSLATWLSLQLHQRPSAEVPIPLQARLSFSATAGRQCWTHSSIFTSLFISVPFAAEIHRTLLHLHAMSQPSRPRYIAPHAIVASAISESCGQRGV